MLRCSSTGCRLVLECTKKVQVIAPGAPGESFWGAGFAIPPAGTTERDSAICCNWHGVCIALEGNV